jgi:hypothetical protein
VTSYAPDADNSGRIVFTVPANSIPDPGIGKFVRARGKNMGVGKPSVLNTNLVLTWLTNTTLRTVKPTATFAFPGVGATLVIPTKTLVPSTNARLQRITERKAGKASYISRGRLAVRARG